MKKNEADFQQLSQEHIIVTDRAKIQAQVYRPQSFLWGLKEVTVSRAVSPVALLELVGTGSQALGESWLLPMLMGDRNGHSIQPW